MALQSERGMSRIFADGLPAATGSTSILSLPRTLMELVLEEVSRKSQGLLAATVCREWAEMAQGCAKVAKLRKGRHLPSLRALPRLESLSLRPDLHDYYHDIPDTTDLNASDFSEFADAFAHLGELQTLEWKLCREIPEAILRLPALKLLRLEGDLSFVPKDVTRLTQLEELEVRISRCGGPPLVVPSELGSMRSLRVLRLDKAPQDHFPASIQDLVGLRALDLSFSWESDSPPAGAWLLDPVFRLTGLKELTLSVPSSLTRFPDSLGNLTRLRMLVLWGHAYELPDSLSQLTQLASFEMFNWMDVFPEVVSTLTSLKHLYLMAEGAARVPESLSRLSRLTSLNLSPGIIGGDFQLPDFFGSFPELKTLIVGSRLVTLPPSLTQLTKLRSLDISQAYLLGTPPDQSLRRRNPPPEPAVVESRARQVDFALGLPALESLRLRLGGPQGCDFPRAICNLTNLRQLQIMSTGKQGGLTHLPTSLGSLRNLTVLSISSMAVSSLPASLGNLILLRQFHLSSLHQLTEIPESIGQMEALEDLRIQCCHKLTQLPSSLGSLTKLVTLMLKDLPDLECLPDGIGNLPLLRRLDLGSLDKVQALPDDFSNLSALEVFILRDWALTSLDPAVGGMRSLRFLMLKTLALKRVPDSIGNLTALVQLYLWLPSLNSPLPGTMVKLARLRSLHCPTWVARRSLSLINNLAAAGQDAAGYQLQLRTFRRKDSLGFVNVPVVREYIRWAGEEHIKHDGDAQIHIGCNELEPRPRARTEAGGAQQGM